MTGFVFILHTIVSLSLTAFAGEKPCLLPSSDVLCELSWTGQDKSNKKIQVYKSTCECPEGNSRPCLDLRVCRNDLQIETGANKFFKETDLKQFCVTKTSVDLLGSSDADKPTAFLKCQNKKYSGELELVSQNNRKKCKLNFSRVLK